MFLLFRVRNFKFSSIKSKYRILISNSFSDHIESGWIEALEATRIYGFSKYRGARENSIKIIINVSLNKPSDNVIAAALKLRKRFGTMIFAIGMFSTDQLEFEIQFSAFPRFLLFLLEVF